MKPDTQEWVRAAEEDFAVANLAFRSRTRKPTASSIGFHCQQCIEKYLKAQMVEDGTPVIKTHDLQTLLNRLVSRHPLWAGFHAPLGNLTDCAVKFRYPGHTATRADARAALKACRSIRAEIRASLGLPKK
ncbi:MAG: HEPN domain-containing protein [Verrucomicrobia bacterium]|nr:HEPN domain-containing protein [Verrucomicrobiota bacterium]